jgi:glucose/arabinose dehydrogenase
MVSSRARFFKPSMLLAAALCLTAPPAARANTPPNIPTITEPATDGEIIHPADLHMETAPFSDPDPGQTHKATDWFVVKNSSGHIVWQALEITDATLKHHIHLGDGQFVNEYAGRTTLEFSENYTFRARHEDNSDDPATQWSNYAQRFFQTATNITPPPGAPSWSVRQPGFVVETVATGFQLPVNIAFAPPHLYPGNRPSDPFFYVAELYGNIRVVTRDGTVSDYATGLLNFSPTGNFPGSGEQGLAGLAVEPVTGDLFASLVFADGDQHFGKVIRLHTTPSGLQSDRITTLLMLEGDPVGPSHQISNVTLHDGHLYVHMGDGFDETKGQDLRSFRGKILRMNLNGTAPADNPFYNVNDGITATDYVFAYGFRNPFGGGWRTSDDMHYEVENGPSRDRLARVVRGANYGYDGSDASMNTRAIYNWQPVVAPVNIAFIQASRFFGSNFPIAKFDHAFVTESGPTFAQGVLENGKRISEFVINANGGLVSGPTPLIEYTGTGYATAVALAPGPDGLYFSELYSENDPDPTAATVKILRVRSTTLNSFAQFRGAYRGLVSSNSASSDDTGFLGLSLTATGRFTARIVLGGKAYSFTGVFDNTGNFNDTISPAGGTPFTVSLSLDTTNRSDTLTGSVNGGGLNAQIDASKSLFSAAFNPAPNAGRYTLTLPGSGNAPVGTGWGTAVVGRAGVVRMVGVLPDLTRITLASRINKDGTWPLFASLYDRQGSLSGLITFQNNPGVSDCDGSLDWFRPAIANAALFPDGFSAQITLKGSRYVPPAQGTRALDFSATANNGQVTFNGGNLNPQPGPITVTLTATNQVVAAPSERFILRINPMNGVFFGTFVVPQTGAIRGASGVIFQKQNVGTGIFLGQDETGSLELDPAP